jgi:hypothetical protein
MFGLTYLWLSGCPRCEGNKATGRPFLTKLDHLAPRTNELFLIAQLHCLKNLSEISFCAVSRIRCTSWYTRLALPTHLPCFSFLARCASVADLQSKGLLEHVELNCHGSMAWNGSSGTLRKKSESGIFGTHLQKMQNSQIP